MTNFPLRNVLSKPDLTGRMAKWAIRLSTYDITYDTRNSIKSQVLADFVDDFSPSQMTDAEKEFQQVFSRVDMKPWTLYTDGAFNVNRTGLGLALKSPQGDIIAQSGSYKAKDPKMVAYLDITKRLTNCFDNFGKEQVRRENNVQADTLAGLGDVLKIWISTIFQ
ncbi:uncharacterized protein LOC141685424 [Apium graveolens]|uniref:uncharacterized protein LOC141685424 n=1 Tax=Apium graveolens TaxID=4045 RepID=UPI003D7BB258